MTASQSSSSSAPRKQAGLSTLDGFPYCPSHRILETVVPWSHSPVIYTLFPRKWDQSWGDHELPITVEVGKVEVGH